ncbi:MAG TPA: Slp family lipoprotein [Rhodanobacteraceae bacterium]|nr:Slp family lipoprotein [Rhodanobacteraceae bacterium]
MFNTKGFNIASGSVHWWKPALAAVGALALGACATIPQPLAGTYTPIQPSQAAQGGAGGAQVRWGGQIIKTTPEAHQTCFYVLSRPLDSTARPMVDSASEGRFMACHEGFYDPEVFTKGREVTFTGTLHGIVSRMVGKYDYAYPRVEASTVYLWPKRPRIVRYENPYYGYGNPFWGPIGPWYDPIWYQPRRVIIVHRPPPPPPPKSGK